jgi:hypothetical protein
MTLDSASADDDSFDPRTATPEPCRMWVRRNMPNRKLKAAARPTSSPDGDA